MKNDHWALEDMETSACIAEQSALLSLRGIGINEQVKVLKREYPGPNITRTKLVTLKKHPKYIEVFKKSAEEMISNGKIELKTGAADLVPAVIACLKTKLSEGDVKAASVVFNILTDNKDSDDSQKQAQSINITLASDAPNLKHV